MADVKNKAMNYFNFQNGFVDENSPVGTKVVDAEGNEISFKVTDADHDSKVCINCQYIC